MKKIALVTGGSRGIGKAIALDLSQNGFDIALNYRSSDEEAKNVKAELERNGSKVLLLKGDVGDFNEVERMVKETIEEFEQIDVLVNNAGITKDNLIMRMKEEDFDAVINTNLKSVFNFSKVVSKFMLKKKSGKIINISSVVGISGNAGQANYAAAKAGVIGLTKTLAKELGRKNINVNAIAPGFIETDMTESLSEDLKNYVKDNIPLGRLGKTEEVSRVVTFLSGDGGNYITGQVITVDGGMVI